MGGSDLREQILANAAEIMCKMNANNAHHVDQHRLIVRRCGKGERKGYKALIVDFSVIRIEGPKSRTMQEALESLFDYTADKLKEWMTDYEAMQFSHIKDEELQKEDGGVRIAVKKAKVNVDGGTPQKAATSSAKKA